MADEFDKFKAKLLENPKIKVEYDALAPEYELIERLMTARKATKEEMNGYKNNDFGRC